jgi:hypothetical protein
VLPVAGKRENGGNRWPKWGRNTPWASSENLLLAVILGTVDDPGLSFDLEAHDRFREKGHSFLKKRGPENLVPHLYVWGANVYHGNSFGTLLSDFAQASAKPLAILEFRTATGKQGLQGTVIEPRAVYQTLQTEWAKADFGHNLYLPLIML